MSEVHFKENKSGGTAREQVVALAGGVGGAKLAEGLQQLLGERLTVVGNVADDEEFWGLHVSPDLDTVMYWLAGVHDEMRGWGLVDESWHTFETLERIGSQPWFRLGDRDLATHLARTGMLRQGKSLTEVTRHLARGWGVRATLLPVTDDHLRTVLETDEGCLRFQEYFVKRQWEPVVRAIHFEGEETSRVTPAVSEAMHRADLIVLCPSNPFVSIEPLLRVFPIRDLLRRARAPVVAVSPIVAGQALKGPAAKLFTELGEPPSAVAVARRYADFLDGFLLDERDAGVAGEVAGLGPCVTLTDTVMNDVSGRRRVAEAVLGLASILRSNGGASRGTVVTPTAESAQHGE